MRRRAATRAPGSRAGRAADRGRHDPRRPRHRHVVRRAGGVRRAAAELPYVNVHRFLAGLGVARCRSSTSTPPTPACCVLEDIGDSPLWDAVQGQPGRGGASTLFERAIDQLLLIQLDGTARADAHCIAFQQAFDERLFDWEFEHFIEHGLVEPRRAAASRAASSRSCATHFGAIARPSSTRSRASSTTATSTPGICTCRTAASACIDFQDALLAPAPYDLATLLGDRDTPTVIRPDLEARLLDYYARGVGGARRRAVAAQQLWDVYAACALQKAFKVVGRFHYLDTVKGKPGYLRYLPPTWRQIARLLDGAPRPRRACGASWRRTRPSCGREGDDPRRRLRQPAAPAHRPHAEAADRRWPASPLIAYPLALLRAAGIREVIINLHHRGDADPRTRSATARPTACRSPIRRRIRFSTPAARSRRRSRSCDGDTLRRAQRRHHLRSRPARRSIAWHRARGALATMVLRPDREAARYGLIEIDAERPHSALPRHAGAGRRAADRADVRRRARLRAGGVRPHGVAAASASTRATYPRMLAAGCPLYGFSFDGYWRVLDTHAGFAEGRWELDSVRSCLAPRHRP